MSVAQVLERNVAKMLVASAVLPRDLLLTARGVIEYMQTSIEHCCRRVLRIICTSICDFVVARAQAQAV